MKLLKTIRQANKKAIINLVIPAFKNLLFVYPTVDATKETMRLSNHYYGRKHYGNGQANAFRHGLWNYLIAKKCTKWSKNKSKVLNWTTFITDWHEEAFPNRLLFKKMDLHNNAIGRQLFLEFNTKSLEEILNLFREKARVSMIVDSKTDLALYTNQFVHICNDA